MEDLLYNIHGARAIQILMILDILCDLDVCYAPGAGAHGGNNLASMSSPFTGTTAGRSSAFSGCGSSSGHTYKFFVVLQPGSSISIGQTSNHFDSRHSAFWSESSDPSSYPSGSSGSSCTDDPDTQTVHMTNTNAAARRAWFVMNGYDSSEYGGFTLAWTIARPTTKAPTSSIIISTGSSGE